MIAPIFAKETAVGRGKKYNCMSDLLNQRRLVTFLKLLMAAQVC